MFGTTAALCSAQFGLFQKINIMIELVDTISQSHKQCFLVLLSTCFRHRWYWRLPRAACFKGRQISV